MNKFISLFADEHSLPNINNHGNFNNHGNRIQINACQDDYLSGFTDLEKDEIVSTLKICTLRHKTLEERESEFSTMCIANGVSTDDTEVAKGLFLYREPENWELNIIALEKGEWATSMATENFKRWRKVRPVMRTDSIFFKQDEPQKADRLALSKSSGAALETTKGEKITDGVEAKVRAKTDKQKQRAHAVVEKKSKMSSFSNHSKARSVHSYRESSL